MQKKTLMIIGGGVILLAAAILLVFSLKGGPPAVPKDLYHSGVINDAACRACHTPGRQAPLGEFHPPNMACLGCHWLLTRGATRLGDL